MIQCGGRNGFNAFNWTKEGLNIYLDNSVNLIPFKTIIEYIQKIFTSLLGTSTIFLNLFGNIACLMPLALFIPMLFKKIDNTKKFLISILYVTLGIELIQFITFTGSCDIDDVILNTLGAFIMYKILSIKDINNLVRNIFLLEKNEVNKKKVAIVIISVLIVCALVLGLYKIGQNCYDENIFEIGYGEQGQGINELTLELYIIPKQSGKATLTLNFGNNAKDNDIVEIREYTITVNENLEVKYEEK